MRLNGRDYTRADYYRRVGSEAQAFGIRAMSYRAGDENLVSTYEMDTGAGLCLSVGENKGMDIYRMSYRGVNLGFMSKAGLHSAYNVNPESDAFRNTMGCGMLYTAGLTNVGGACQGEKGPYCTHGGIKNCAAGNLCARGEWQGDEYLMEISGEMREAAFYGRNLVMRRSIRAKAGGRSFTLEDRIENRAFDEDQLMLLYHFNAGFPFLDAGVRLYAPVKSVEGATPRAREMIGSYDRASAPVDMEEEHVYLIELGRDAEGRSGSVLWNEDMRLGLFTRFDTALLDHFVEWKCMRSGDYAMGMLPANCYPFGREEAARSGGWTRLAPMAQVTARLEFGVLDGRAELDEFLAWIGEMK